MNIYRYFVVILSFLIVFYIIWKLKKNKVPISFIYIFSLIVGILLSFIYEVADSLYLLGIVRIFLNIIESCLAPLIITSVIWNILQLGMESKANKITAISIFWLLFGSLIAVTISVIAQLLFNFGKYSFDLFKGINDISEIYKPIDLYTLLSGLFPSNMLNMYINNNLLAISISAIIIAIVLLSIQKSIPQFMSNFTMSLEVVRSIVFKLLKVLMDLLPYIIVMISAAKMNIMLENTKMMLDLLSLLGLIYGLYFGNIFIFNGFLIIIKTKLNPIPFFKKMLSVMGTAFITQSSLETLPQSVYVLKNDLGVDERVSEVTLSVGTTVGMPGGIAIWPILTILYYVNAINIDWQIAEICLLVCSCLICTIICVGVPGASLVVSMIILNMVGLPTTVVMAFLPLSILSGAGESVCNLMNSVTATLIVAKKSNSIDLDTYYS